MADWNCVDDEPVQPGTGAFSHGQCPLPEIGGINLNREPVNESLESLSPDHRLALMLREVDGLSYEEIAKITGCRKGTVMSRIFYARKKVQERLGELR